MDAETLAKELGALLKAFPPRVHEKIRAALQDEHDQYLRIFERLDTLTTMHNARMAEYCGPHHSARRNLGDWVIAILSGDIGGKRL